MTYKLIQKSDDRFVSITLCLYYSLFGHSW